MGGELVRLAYAASFLQDERDASMTSNERAVLLYLCSTAHDSDERPRYWGGRNAIARYALGRRVPTDSDEGSRKEKRSIYEVVRRALDGLISRGLIERSGEAYPGHSQEYLIKVRDNTTLGHTQHHVGPFGNTTLPKTQRHVGPETQHTQPPTEKPRSPKRAPYVRPVEKQDGVSHESVA